MCILLYVKLICVVVFHRFMVTWRRGRSEFSWFSGIPQIYDELGGGHLRVHLV